MGYLGRRALHGVLLLVGVSVLSFAFFELAPGDFYDEVELNPQISPETLAHLRARHGMDRSLPERYLSWVASVLRGELGYSLAYNSPVGPLLWPRARNTLVLTGLATLVTWIVAVPLGVWWAARSGRWGDRLGAVGSSVLLTVPDLVLALGLLLIAVRSGVVPTGGMVSPGFGELGAWERVRDLGAHLLLPVAALVLGSLPVVVRHVRASMVEVLRSPFVQAARGHGIPARRVLFRHALPAAANPLISLFGFSVASLLSMSLLVEVVMSWPGLGPLMLEAILARDLYLILGPVMASAGLLVAGNLLADVLLFVADPRIREG